MTSASSVCGPLSQEHLLSPGARCPRLGRASGKGTLIQPSVVSGLGEAAKRHSVFYPERKATANH